MAVLGVQKKKPSSSRDRVIVVIYPPAVISGKASFFKAGVWGEGPALRPVPDCPCLNLRISNDIETPPLPQKVLRFY